MDTFFLNSQVPVQVAYHAYYDLFLIKSSVMWLIQNNANGHNYTMYTMLYSLHSNDYERS